MAVLIAKAPFLTASRLPALTSAYSSPISSSVTPISALIVPASGGSWASARGWPITLRLPHPREPPSQGSRKKWVEPFTQLLKRAHFPVCVALDGHRVQLFSSRLTHRQPVVLAQSGDFMAQKTVTFHCLFLGAVLLALSRIPTPTISRRRSVGTELTPEPAILVPN